MLSKNMATEFIPMNIRVNTINPGLILTPDWIKTAKQLSADTGGDWEGYLQSVADEHAPIKRFGTVEELADFFVFLCSDRASPTRSAPPTTSTAACSAQSEEARHGRCPVARRRSPTCPTRVARPSYARADLSPGIVHFGVGNFHRAHLQVYLDRLMNAGRDLDWAIVGAGVTPYDVKMRDALAGPGLALHRRRAVGRDLLRPRHRRDDRLPAADGRHGDHRASSPTPPSASSR